MGLGQKEETKSRERPLLPSMTGRHTYCFGNRSGMLQILAAQEGAPMGIVPSGQRMLKAERVENTVRIVSQPGGDA